MYLMATGYNLADFRLENPYTRTQSGYHNSLLYFLDNLREDFSEIFTTDLHLTNGAFKYSKPSINLIHRVSEFSKSAVVNLSNVDFGIESFILPPKLKKSNVTKGTLVVIPDFTKNQELGLSIIEKNPDTVFKVVMSYRNRPMYKIPYKNTVVLRGTTDVHEIFQDSSLALFISNAHYETFGIFPLEAMALNIPCIISDRYKIPFTQTVCTGDVVSWINFKNVRTLNSTEIFNQYTEFQKNRFNLFKDLIKNKLNI